MSVAVAARNLAVEAKIYLADPVSGAPQAPGGSEGKAQTGANTIYSAGLWVVIAIAAIATLGAGVKIFLDHQEGRKNPGIGALATIFGGVIVALVGASLVGSVSGT